MNVKNDVKEMFVALSAW